MLALFDNNGIRVYTNDADIVDDLNSKLPANHALGPQSAGDYYLAISDNDRAALSGTASFIDDIIFPLPASPYTQIFGPTGNGGNFPLAGWGSLQSDVPLNASYGINLTGAEFVVPIPGAIWLFLSSSIGLLCIRKKRSMINTGLNSSFNLAKFL